MNRAAWAGVVTATAAFTQWSALLLGCGGANDEAAATNAGASSARAAADAAKAPVTAATPLRLTLLGTNDLHGRIGALPLFAGYVADVRQEVGAGSVVLLDAGDMFQGTLESNLAEGAPVILGYNAIGYDAVAIGNHEFDFGPVGPLSTPQSATDDPRGALAARAEEAHFPFLAANVADAQTHQAVHWTNVQPTVLLDKSGVKVGIVGVATSDVPKTTIASNFAGLEILPLDAVVRARAGELRAAGADVVFLVAHAGGKCRAFGEDASPCDKDEEIMHLLEALPPGTVDAIVAGHTHAGMANRIAGVPVIESHFYGKAFGRIDFTLDPATHKIVGSKIFPPTMLTPAPTPSAATAAPVAAPTYDGLPVVADAKLAALLQPFADRAKARKEEKIGITLDTPITREHGHESAEGNLFADLLRLGVPGADIAMMNGGGLRADLPAGELTYGALFEAMPFDNRVAVVKLTGADLRKVVVDNLGHSSGIASWSGLRVVSECTKGNLEVRLEHAGRASGKEIKDGDALTLITSDFVALGGDGVPLPPDSFTVGAAALREVFEEQLRKRGGHLSAKQVFDPTKRRVVYPGERPVKCD